MESGGLDKDIQVLYDLKTNYIIYAKQFICVK